MAGVVRFTGETTGPSVGTTINGFHEVLGPGATDTEHAGDFVGPQPEYMPTLPGRPCHRVPRRSARGSRMDCDPCHRSADRTHHRLVLAASQFDFAGTSRPLHAT
jgi:hypothetical protein